MTWQRNVEGAAAAKRARTHCVNGHEFTDENTYRDKNGWRRCVECRKAANRRRFAKQEAKVKQRARKKLAYAVEVGKIIRPEACERCGTAADVQGHHADYSAPLSVVWLCSACHGQEHAELIEVPSVSEREWRAVCAL